MDERSNTAAQSTNQVDNDQIMKTFQFNATRIGLSLALVAARAVASTSVFRLQAADAGTAPAAPSCHKPDAAVDKDAAPTCHMTAGEQPMAHGCCAAPAADSAPATAPAPRHMMMGCCMKPAVAPTPAPESAPEKK
jgi:hypothetical protein